MITPNYDTGFYTWTRVQATALRAKDWRALDVDHLAEDIEALGKSDWRALESHLKNLILHRSGLGAASAGRSVWTMPATPSSKSCAITQASSGACIQR